MGLITLVVDDCAAIRGYVRKQLNATRLEIDEVLEAGDGAEALNVLEASLRKGVRPDFIITDIHMPGMSGETFIERLRDSREFREVPVLVFSSDASQSRTLRMRSLGVRGYVTKPCEPSVLRSKIENVINPRDAKLQSSPGCGLPVSPAGSRSILILGSARARNGNLEQELAKMGYRVSVADSLAEALREVDGDFPDLFITDVHLNESGDGIEAAAHLLDICDCPVLYVTADSTDEIVERALGTNPYGYLTEPFHNNALRSALLSAFYKQEARRQHRTRERLFAGVLSSLTDALLVTNGKGIVVLANPAAAELCGHTIASTTGKKLNEVFRISSEDDPELVTSLIHAALQQKTPSINGGSAMLARCHGEAIGVAYQLAPIWRDSGSCEGIVVTFAAANSVEGKAGELARLRALERAAEAQPLRGMRSASSSKAAAPVPPPATACSTVNAATSTPPASADPIEGVDSREEAAQVLRQALAQANERHFVIIFVMERFRFYEKRFGQASLKSARTVYSQHLVSMLWPEDQLYEWDDNAFIVLTERPWSMDEMRREIAMIACKRIEHTVHPAGRVAMLVLTSCWELRALQQYHSPDVLIAEIESFRQRKST